MADAALTVLTPEVRPATPFPRVAPWVLGVSLLAGVLADGHFELQAAASAVGAIAAFSIAHWCEQRLYDRLARRKVFSRVALSLLLPPALQLTALVGGALLALIPRFGVVALVFALGAIWLASAASGSLIIVVLDLSVSAVVRDFKARVTLAILGLLGVVLFVSYEVARVFAEFTEGIRASAAKMPTGSKVTIQLDGGALTARETALVLADPENATSIAMMLFLMPMLFFALPSMLSACSKLADAVMERLHPLSRAFAMVAQGSLAVRVEEKGSQDFVDLSRRFNEMVAALALAQRMEQTFGVYVGEQLMDRIRAQHGEAALPASLRQASVFFADIRGFTSMSERLEPQQVLDVLNRYFERVVTIIDAHEGYLDKFIGDAVVVVFSGPVDQPDHAVRAARCAIALQQEVAAMNARQAFPEIGELKVGVGLATGPLVAGNVGSIRHYEYTVIGDTVNLAARLTSHAPAGEVWVNPTNAEALPKEMARAALEPIKVKGKELPVQPFRIWPPAKG